jgi:signal transduction histidine kinase
MSTSRPWSIQRWLAWLVAGVVLPVLILLLWTGIVQVRREQTEARQTALNMARATAGRMRDRHLESVALLAQMRARPGVASFDPGACHSVFAAVDFLPRYADVFLFDESGALVCSGNTEAANEAISLEARRWIEGELRAGRLRAGVPVAHTFSKRPILVLASPVRGRAARGNIVLVEFLNALSRDVQVPGAVITILDRNGTIVARSDQSDEWTGRNAHRSELVVAASKAREGFAVATGVDGVSRQYGFTHIPELGWSVYAGVPISAIREPVREMIVNGAIGAAGIVFIVGVMTVVLARKIAGPLHALVEAARTADEGAYSRVERVEGPLEIATLAHAFNHMVDRREEADDRMRSGERKLKALSDRLLTVQEEERSRIARELHDDLGQSLTALKMDVIGLLKATAQPPEVAPIRGRILRTLDATVASVQQISSELRPSVLDDLGLIAAIEAEARLFEERSGIECEVSVGGDVPIDDDCITPIYRIVQEALTNVARHSNATRTEVRLHTGDGNLLLEIRDDGRGLTGREIGDSMSLGLIGIRERADLIGGKVQFEGVEGRGTIVSVRVPLPRKESKKEPRKGRAE